MNGSIPNWGNIFAQAITPEDQRYFRASREQKLGKTLESIDAIAPQKRQLIGAALEPVRERLLVNRYLGGERPDYQDICLLSSFLWLFTLTDIQLLEKEDGVYHWYQHMLAYFSETLPHTVKISA
jgi:glutathione S-transferase